MRVFILLGILAACGRAEAGDRTSFMPENNLYLEDRYTATSMSEQTFNQLIDRFESIYSPIVRNFGARLVIERRYSDPTVNAYAQKNGSTWQLSFFGGLARRSEVNNDGFLGVICHEAGHLVAGFPNYPGEDMANEGQSDYFATHVCLKKVFASDTSNVQYLATKAVADCKALYTGQKLRVCYHALSGAQSTANLLSVLNGERKPRFDTPDTSIVSQTMSEHPASQCRLDTMFAGSLCQAPWSDSIIPSAGNQATYNCTMETVPAKIRTTRPLCWYHP